MYIFQGGISLANDFTVLVQLLVTTAPPSTCLCHYDQELTRWLICHLWLVNGSRTGAKREKNNNRLQCLPFVQLGAAYWVSSLV